MSRLYTRRAFLASGALAATAFACRPFLGDPLIKIFHAPRRFARRAGAFTANVCGVLAREINQARYRLNGGPWWEVRHALPRVPSPWFTIELEADRLRAGGNQLLLEAKSYLGLKPEIKEVDFHYDPSPIVLPVRQDWPEADLDVQDGYWQTLPVNGTRWVRPVPRTEDYDRIIVACGACEGARRIEMEMIYRYNTSGDRPFGFGVLPLWGGRPDDDGVTPRRGWSFSLAWYYSHYGGAGMEFSYKHGDAAPTWVSSYRNLELKRDQRHHLVIEVWPEKDLHGRHLRHRQRMWWHAEGQGDSDLQMELADTAGAPIPAGEYGVALIAHRCQIEFGPVLVSPLDAAQSTG